MEYMDNHRTVIQKYPPAFLFPLDVGRFNFLFGKRIGYSIRDGFDLYIAFTGKNYEIIGNYGERLEIKD